MGGHGSKPRTTGEFQSIRMQIKARRDDCYICGEPIDYDAKPCTYNAFELDHVIPRALGGTDTYANLKASHYHCNQKKGASTCTVDITGFYHTGY